jgi:hypothetical protein
MSSQSFMFVNTKQIVYNKHLESYTILQLLDLMEISVPRFCAHRELTIAGNCRMCIVQVEGSLKPIVSCCALPSSGIVIHTDSTFLKKRQQGILEFLLLNHPLDCPICDQGGHCDLQDLSFFYGQDVSRFTGQRRSRYPQFISSLIVTEMTRCIHCTRCLRFFDELLDLPHLGMMGRGSDSYISTYYNSKDTNLYHPLLMNVADICPVGALYTTASMSKRPWNLESLPYIDVLDPYLSLVSLELSSDVLYEILPQSTLPYSFISNSTRLLWQSLSSFVLRGVSVRKTLFEKKISYKRLLLRLSSSLSSHLYYLDSFFFVCGFVDIQKRLFFNSFTSLFTPNHSFLSQIDFSIRRYFSFPTKDTYSFFFFFVCVDVQLPLLGTYLNKNKDSLKCIFYVGKMLKFRRKELHLTTQNISSINIFMGKDSRSALCVNQQFHTIKPRLFSESVLPNTIDSKESILCSNIFNITTELPKAQTLTSFSLKVNNVIQTILSFYTTLSFSISNTHYSLSTHPYMYSERVCYRLFQAPSITFLELPNIYIDISGKIKSVSSILENTLTYNPDYLICLLIKHTVSVPFIYFRLHMSCISSYIRMYTQTEQLLDYSLEQQTDLKVCYSNANTLTLQNTNLLELDYLSKWNITLSTFTDTTDTLLYK